MPTRVFLVLVLLFGSLAFCALPAQAECRTEAGFTACPKDEFARLMEKLATARGEAKTCAVDLGEAKGKLEDTQAALAKVPVIQPDPPKTRYLLALGAFGGALLAGSPWLASNDAARATIVSTGLLSLAAGWFLSE